MKCLCINNVFPQRFISENTYSEGEIYYYQHTMYYYLVYYENIVGHFINFINFNPDEFDQHFVDLVEYRNNKIEEILK